MLEPDARAGPPVDKEALSALKRDFDIADHVMIHEGIPGMLRVMMRHGSERRVAWVELCPCNVPAPWDECD